MRHDAQIVRVMEGGTGMFYLWSDGILSYKYDAAGKAINLRMLELDIKAIDGLREGEKIKFLSDLRGVSKFEPEHRKVISQHMGIAFVKAAALIDSPVSKVIMNIFMILNRPSIPSRIFNDMDSATLWLKQ